jgi:hypothetical protein
VVRATALTPRPVAIVIRLYLTRGWRTDLPRLVLLLQAGNAVSFFGYGLILPFEIIYLLQIRGFATATAGLVLATILDTATLVTPPPGTLPASPGWPGTPVSTTLTGSAQHHAGMAPAPKRLICAR